MSIDWFTFTAQIINFLILVGLLARFLYKPIVEAMAQREEKIAASLNEAHQAQTRAEAAEATFRQETEALAHAKDDLLAEASREVERWRKQHQAEARDEVDSLKAQWYRALDRERESFIREARMRIAEHVHNVARQILRQLADEELESRTISVLARRLEQLEPRQKQAVSESIRESSNRVQVASGFPLSQPQKEQVATLLNQQLQLNLTPDFRTEPELIFGIELRVHGHKVAWSASEQLEQLDEEFVRSVNEALAHEVS